MTVSKREVVYTFFKSEFPTCPYYVYESYINRYRSLGSTFENLLSQLCCQRHDYEKLINKEICRNQTRIEKHFISSLVRNYIRWYKLVVDCLLSFWFVKSFLFRELIRYSDMSVKTFMKYLPNLAEAVKNGGKFSSSRTLSDIRPMFMLNISPSCDIFFFLLQ